MSEETKNWNNQIRATNAAIAIAAYREAKGEGDEIDLEDIDSLIIDLLHLSALVSQQDRADLVMHALSVADDEEDEDKDFGEIAYQRRPTNGVEILKAWADIDGELTRELMLEPPKIQDCECGRPVNECAIMDGGTQHQDRD